MKYRRLSENWDYVFGNNIDDYVEGPVGIAYAIKSKVLLFYGEWWEDLGMGIPMFQSIIGQKGQENIQRALELLLKQRIEELDEVSSVDSIRSSYSNRGITVSIECTVTYNRDTESIKVEVII